ncbi:MAG: hypothetical protein K2X66_16875 [Cyanobacteria bacterium]|nr:hypothetical protein [Cyanobacteriota bacterium]
MKLKSLQQALLVSITCLFALSGVTAYSDIPPGPYPRPNPRPPIVKPLPKPAPKPGTPQPTLPNIPNKAESTQQPWEVMSLAVLIFVGGVLYLKLQSQKQNGPTFA